MSIEVSKYQNARKYILNGSVDFDTDTIKLALVSSAYTFTTTCAGWVGSLTTWSSAVSYSLNSRVRPTTANGHWYLCTVGGTSGGSEPTWPTNGSTVTDGTATWEDQGFNPAAAEISGVGYIPGGASLSGKTVTCDATYGTFDANDVIWTNSTLTARRAEMYKLGTVNGVENPLLCSFLLDNTPADVSSYNSDFSIVWDTNGIFRIA
jgi:hypothetical protein